MISKVLGVDFDQFLDLSITAVVLYLVLSRAQGFATMMRAFSGAYTSSIKALQGR